MIERGRLWWKGRSQRERLMLGVMTLLVAGFIGWLALYRPLVGASSSLAGALEIAAQRKAAIAVKVEQLKAAAAHPVRRANGVMTALVEQSAKQAGVTLETVDARDGDRVSITIASTRSPDLLAWLGALEAEGISVETATMAPAEPAGYIRLQAVLYRLDPRI